MAAYYADSSAQVKRHVPEAGSTWFISLTDPSSGNTIVTARLSLTEIYSALNRPGMQVTGVAPPIFLSADSRLLTAAQAEGFATDNPNLH